MIKLDKEEFRIKLEEINNLVEAKDYKSAMDIVDSIDWRRVKSVRTLCTVGEIYAANKRYEDSREIFLLAYHRSSVGKTILYRLIEVSIKMGDLDEALEYYSEFVNAAPNDNTRYVLKYKIYSARKASLEEQIAILEEYREKEFTERWSFELAKLYYQAGEKTKCIGICDDIVLWFSEGKYVARSLELKRRLTELSPAQERIYDEYFNPKPVLERPVFEKPVKPVSEKPVSEEKVKEEVPPEDTSSDEIPSESTSAKEVFEKEEEKTSFKETLQNISMTTPVIEEDENFQQKLSDSIKSIFKTGNKGKHSEQVKAEEDAEKQVTGQINIADVIPAVVEPEKKETEEVVSENIESEGVQEETMEIPELEAEPEIFKQGNLPTLNLPKVDLNERARVEDLPISDTLEFNLEDTILAAAKEQGIEVPKEFPSAPSFSEPKEIIEDKAEMEQPVEPEDIKPLEEEKITESVPEQEISEEETDEDFPEDELTSEDEIQEEEFEEAQEIVPQEEELTEEEKLMRFIDAQNMDPNADSKDIIPREDDLDEDEIKLFTYFSSIPGMKEQLLESLKDTQMAAADKTSGYGNVIIMGNRGSGKTTLAEKLIKAICRELKRPAAKTAKVTAEQINGKDIARIVGKLSGGYLLIQNTNQLTADTVDQLNKAMEFRTDGLTVILEDEKIGMRKFIAKYPKFVAKFTSTISIPVFTNDELVNFAKVYTNEMGYRIEDMGILALYTLISDNQKEDEPMTIGGVKIFIDNAIAKAESGTRKLQRNLSKTRTDNEGLVLLYEKDFK